MRDGRAEPIRSDHDDAVVLRFAARVVALLSSRDGALAQPIRPETIDMLEAAVIADDPEKLTDCLVECRRRRISAEALCDVYIPEVARKLGQGWVYDRLSFLEVSVGASRLQALLREIGARWRSDACADQGGGEVFLIVPEGEQHTLGAMVTMGALRRRGVSVCLRVAPSTVELRSLLEDRRFDGVFLSLASNDALRACRALVSDIRDGTGDLVPIIVGGAVDAGEAEILRLTSADFATSDLDAAMRACGLLPTTQKSRSHA
jgi:MerR family transcriptional regulator, light-induced transcriptional regulator